MGSLNESMVDIHAAQQKGNCAAAHRAELAEAKSGDVPTPFRPRLVTTWALGTYVRRHVLAVYGTAVLPWPVKYQDLHFRSLQKPSANASELGRGPHGLPRSNLRIWYSKSWISSHGEFLDLAR